MRKIFNKFFYIPKHGKVLEKVMLTRLISTITIVIMCLAAMSITAYAYFSYNITSGSNTIKAANFEAQINITDEKDAPVVSSDKDGYITIFNFVEAGTYTVILTKGDNSTADTGFCIVRISDDLYYHTQQIGVDISDDNKSRDSVSFQLQVDGATTIGIESHWGTSSFYGYDITDQNARYIKNSDPLTVVVAGTTMSSIDNLGESIEAGTIATEPTEVIYTVVSGDTLTKIAGQYDVLIPNLKAYNGLTSNAINVGQTLKIPPADYKAPETTVDQTTTPPETETTAPTTDTTESQETTTSSTTVTEPVPSTTHEETAGTDTSTETIEATTE